MIRAGQYPEAGQGRIIEVSGAQTSTGAMTVPVEGAALACAEDVVALSQ